MNAFIKGINKSREHRYKIQFNAIVRKIKVFEDASLDALYLKFQEAYVRPHTELSVLVACLYLIIKHELGKELYEEQIIAALAMRDGFVVQMATGEGKTIVQFVSAVCKTLEGSVYIITCNDYLCPKRLFTVPRNYTKDWE